MIFYSDDKIVIRGMTKEDVPIIVREEIEQGWHASEDKYLSRLADMKRGVSVALTAVYGGNIAGYINVYFCGGTPEIVDFGVLGKYRRNGIGTKLMDAAEKIAFQKSDTVRISVGLHSGYGSAQRMYVKRGYIPDGAGVYYDDKPCVPYENYKNDDCLILKLCKTSERREV